MIVSMGTRMLLLMLLLLSVMHASAEVEVELAADGSVITENQRLESAAKDSQPSVAMKNAKVVELSEKDTVDIQENNVDMLTTLQQELSVVDQMVKLQEKKLHALQQMREIWLQEHKMKMQEDEETKRRSRVDVGEVIERRLEAAIAEAVAESRDFDTYFVERASIELNGEVAAMKTMKIRAGNAMELVAVAYRNGVVVFYTSSAEELLRVDTERKGVRSIAMDSLDGQPCLVVTYETSKIAIYELKLAEKSKEDVDGKDQSTMITISSGPEHQLSVNVHRTIELSAKPSVAAIVRSSRQLVVVVAQVDGIIDFLALNGTILRQIQTHASISAMETKRNLLAFSNGTNVVVSSMARAQGTIFHTCPGSSAQVSSIAFDPMQPEIMYAGTHRAEILVYSVSAGAPAEVSPCRLLSRSTVTKYPRDESPVVLATTKMYVLAAEFQDITVFNVSKAQRNGASLSRMCTSHLNRPTTSIENNHLQNGAYLPAMAFSEGSMGSHLAFVAAGVSGQTNLLLFHSLLPDEKETSDFQWTVVIYAGVVIAAVVGSQLFIRWQRRTSVNPWDSIGKNQDSPYEKYGGFKGDEHSSHFDEDFGCYNSLSDDLRKKIAQAKKESGHRPMDDDADY